MNRVLIVQILAVSMVMFSSVLLAQDSLIHKTHSASFKTQFFQFKDEFNYGLVFSGINLVAGYSFTKESVKNTLAYDPELGFGANFNKGAGLAWRFKPIDIFYGYKTNAKSLTVGAYFAADYQWQQYSELQGGRLFWFTAIEIGPQLIYSLPYRSKLIKIMFSNSIAGFTSRPEPATEEYFYAFDLSEFISSAHRDLKFGSFDRFNHTNLAIELQNNPRKRFSLSYAFEYFGYYQDPRLSYINHSLNLNWIIGRL